MFRGYSPVNQLDVPQSGTKYDRRPVQHIFYKKRKCVCVCVCVCVCEKWVNMGPGSKKVGHSRPSNSQDIDRKLQSSTGQLVYSH